MFMDWLKKAPTSVVITVIITCGFLAALVIGAFVLLQLQGADTTEFRQWVQTLVPLLTLPLVGTATVAGISAAKSAAKADAQTNGQLHARDQKLQEAEEHRDRLEAEIRRLTR